MVNNSNNFNKTNNHLSPQTTWHKRITTYGTGYPDPGLGQAQTFCGIIPVNGILTLPSDYWCSIDNADIHK